MLELPPYKPDEIRNLTKSFLEECAQLFNSTKPFKHIFGGNKEPLMDLREVYEKNIQHVFVSYLPKLPFRKEMPTDEVIYDRSESSSSLDESTLAEYRQPIRTHQPTTMHRSSVISYSMDKSSDRTSKMSTIQE